MRPLPRVHAVTDRAVLALEDLGIRAAAIAAAGPVTALHVRDHEAGGAALTAVTRRFLALARPPEAAVIVNGHPDIAVALGAQGAQLGATDLTAADARRIMPHGWLGASVHSVEEAEQAGEVDFFMAGTVYGTASHPGRAGGGPALVEAIARLGRPVIAIGGVTADRLPELRDAGAWGAAAISALWYAPDPAAAALSFAEPWMAGHA
jgi:thiamine-phosphate pyrophosphorylase